MQPTPEHINPNLLDRRLFSRVGIISVLLLRLLGWKGWCCRSGPLYRSEEFCLLRLHSLKKLLLAPLPFLMICHVAICRKAAVIAMLI